MSNSGESPAADWSGPESVSSAGYRRPQRMCQSAESLQARNSPTVPLETRVAHMA